MPIPRPPGTAPARPKPRQPWREARVGDAVEYTYSYSSSPRRPLPFGPAGSPMRPAPPDERMEVQAVIGMEVVALESPWVWVQVTAKLKDRPERRFLVPVNQGPPPVPPQHYQVGTPTGKQAQVKVGEVMATCQETRNDQRPGDGPLTESCDSDEPGLYLGRRVRETFAGSGMGGSAHSTLQATRFVRGPEAAAPATAPPKGLPRLSAPDVFYRRIPAPTVTSDRALEGQELFFAGQRVSRVRGIGDAPDVSHVEIPPRLPARGPCTC